MQLLGKNLINGSGSAQGNQMFHGVNPATGEELGPSYVEATRSEIDQAVQLAAEAFPYNRSLPSEARAKLLENIATSIEALGDPLIERVMTETALPEARVRAERGRTTAQLRMFADLVREGSWIDARIDRAIPDRTPIPKPDLRRMLVPLGPVAVFGASNFPLAFSVAGGDTASALAAGCPVIVKAHPAHPGTSELVGRAIQEAVAASPFHPGTFSLLNGRAPEISLALVRHPQVTAVAFTGSLRAGRAIYDAAARRPEPIPVYAEMGSVNPVFLLPGAVAERGDQLADGLSQSCCLGVGQFCTNPGLVLGLSSAGFGRFLAAAAARFSGLSQGTMLSSGISQGYRQGLAELASVPGVRILAGSVAHGSQSDSSAVAVLFVTDDRTFVDHPRLAEEVFGPSSLVVECASPDRLREIAASLPGSLTATIHGTEQDLADFEWLLRLIESRVGRIVFNGFPTGVEVCPSMHHGGPYPATTDPKFTSVGTAAIYRFARPVCYQNFPQSALPEELQDGNPKGIWRLVDGKLQGGR